MATHQRPGDAVDGSDIGFSVAHGADALDMCAGEAHGARPRTSGMLDRGDEADPPRQAVEPVDRRRGAAEVVHRRCPAGDQHTSVGRPDALRDRRLERADDSHVITESCDERPAARLADHQLGRRPRLVHIVGPVECGWDPWHEPVDRSPQHARGGLRLGERVHGERRHAARCPRPGHPRATRLSTGRIGWLNGRTP